ncbi:ChaN family lipoprotein [Thiovibrio sp. JS02]
MQKQLWLPSTDYANRKTCGRSRHERPFSLLVLLACLLLTAMPGAVHAGQTYPPRQELHVSFDLPRHTLTGTARLILPAGQEYSLNLTGLAVSSLTLNGGPLPTAEHLLLPARDEEQILQLSYQKTYAPGVSADGLIGPDAIALTGAWHPRLNLDCLFTLTAEVPKNFEAVSEAEETTSTVAGESKEVRFHFPHPLGGLDLIAGPYVVTREPFGNGQTLYSYFFAEDQELAAEYRRKALAYLARYQELLGPYPYKRFAIVENRLPTGYAMPTFTLLGQAVVRLPFITDTSLGHEILHSWLGNSVFIDYASGNWCEGLTTYLADQAFAHDRGEDEEFRRQQLINYQSYVGPENTIALRDFTGGVSHLDPLGKELRAVGYGRSSMLFHMLFKRIGDAAFTAGLRDFCARLRFKRASWQDLEESFARSSGQDLSAFFSQWLNRADLPRLKVSVEDLTEEEGRPRLALTVKQLQKEPYQLTVPLKIITPTGSELHEIVLTETESRTELSLDDSPTLLVLDPDYDLMRELTEKELPPTWSRFAGAREKLAILPAAEEEEAYAPLLEILSAMECPTKPANEVTDKEVAEKSVLFLGTSSRLARSLFAGPPPPPTGFTLDARQNPLNPATVAVLISSANAGETAAAGQKLIHYGKYGFLRFEKGRVVEKGVPETEQGQHLAIDPPPVGLALPQSLSFADIARQLADKQVVYVGENHTRYADHLLQLRVIRALFAENPKLAIGMEMFSRDMQPVLDRYLAREFDEWEFLKKSSYFSRWGYDYRFYRDIINFARAKQIPIVALNQEKERVSKIFKEGSTTALTEEDLAKVPADRDLSIAGYRERIADVFTMHGQHGATPEQVNGFFQAQALWDETMAESVANYLSANPEQRMVVIAGQGHTVKDTAIPPRVARRLPRIRQAVILNAEDAEPNPQEADYLIFCRPDELPPPPVLGVMLTDGEEGVVVSGLSEQGKGKEAGIREKDVILAVDDEPVADIDDLKIIMLYKKKGMPVTVRIKRKTGFWSGTGKELSITVPL